MVFKLIQLSKLKLKLTMISYCFALADAVQFLLLLSEKHKNNIYFQ